MTTVDQYLKLATHYSKLAEGARRNSYSRHQLQMLADNYMTLAKGTLILDRSAKVLEALEQSRKT